MLGSGPTYTVGLMLSLCKYPFSYIHVNLREGQHKQPDYLVKNRYGQVPALRDGQAYYVQSAAILQHLADELHKFDGKTELERNRIREWLFWQWDKLAVPVFRLGRARGACASSATKCASCMTPRPRRRWPCWKTNSASPSGSPPSAPPLPTSASMACCAMRRKPTSTSRPIPTSAAWKKRFEALPGFGTPEQILPMESRLL